MRWFRRRPRPVVVEVVGSNGRPQPLTLVPGETFTGKYAVDLYLDEDLPNGTTLTGHLQVLAPLRLRLAQS